MIREWGHLEGRTLHHQQEGRESTEAQAGDVASSWEAAGWKLEELGGHMHVGDSEMDPKRCVWDVGV